MKFKVFTVSLFFVCSLLPGICLSQNKVVVIPLLEKPSGPPAPVPKTGAGNIDGYILTDGEDGKLKRGVAWPNPRFTDNGDGTVTDNMTGLIWFENAGCAELTDWSTAVWACSKLGTGDCGLNDGSNAGDWRLPNVLELQSLVDYGNSVPALPAGHPFINVASHYYWTGTTRPGDTNLAWTIELGTGDVESVLKGLDTLFLWPVRGGTK